LPLKAKVKVNPAEQGLSQVKVVNQTVYLFSIFDKTEKDIISDKEIKELIKNIPV
jgi:hypothetical protein